ncbi:hypothetical protein D915_003975 [Fasciola hepatica]|uniref:RWD domain-containing protein n=1 Tax=Fasciola hepatica TaxID=6192 RepID=A0A4E0RA18_FASHE|nr:hypothetical protein D915_003975 [Fasciola hepatica]
MRSTNPQDHIELPEVQASRIAVDSSGQFAALAGCRDLTVLAFDQPNQLHTLPLNSRSEPTGLSWHPDNTGQLAVVRYNRCELLKWDVTVGRLSICHGLGGYVRPITSFDWSPCHPYLLVTSSADQFRAICVWDLRDLTRPARAIESLSAPTVIKWNRIVQEKFACCHRNEIRLWDLRTNVPEQYLTESSGTAVLDFDWRPTEQLELCAAYRDGQLHVWHCASPDAPNCSTHLSPGPARTVSYSPSGDHVITLPEPTNWSLLGLATWSANGLRKSTRGLWALDGERSRTLQPRPTDPVVSAFAWRKISNSAGVVRQAEPDECFSPDGDEQCGMESVLNECSVQLVTWSLDHQIRLYPIQCSLISTTMESLSRVPSNNTSARLTGQSSGATELTSPSACEVRTVSPRLKSPGANTTTSITATGSTVSTAIGSPVEARPHSIRRLQSSTVPGTKYKSTDQPSMREDDVHSRLGIARWASSGPSPQNQAGDLRDRVSSVEDDGYQVLAQELSLLSPRAGQYKLEEIDLINRNAKLMLFYCRRKHFHHYTVCAVPTSGDRDRRNSAELDESGDLESLLLPESDLLPSIDASNRTEPWRPIERNKSSEELDTLSRDEMSRDAASESRSHESQQASVKVVANQSGQDTQSATAGLTLQTSPLPEPRKMEFTMPLSGTVALSVAFPPTYPATVPVFTVTDHEPPLPNEVIQQLKEVLHNTASELTHTSRGCMEPCVRKAVDFLQKVTTLHLSSSENRSGVASEDRTDFTLASDQPSRTGEHIPSDTVSENFLSSTSTRLGQDDALRCPFPRLSGVHFAPNGYLVAFGLSNGRWNAIVSNVLTSANTGSPDASPTPLLAELHGRSFLPRSFYEYGQIRQVMRSTRAHRISRDRADYREDSDQTAQLTEEVHVPDEEESETTGVDRNSGELQLKEMIQELVLGSIEVGKITNVSSPKINQVSQCNRSQRHRRTERRLVSEKDSASARTPEITRTHAEKSGIPDYALSECRSLVQLYDLTALIVDSRLIHQYSLKNENVHEMCVHNYLVSLVIGRKDLIRFWQYVIVLSASFTSYSSDCGAIPPWPLQPMGWPLFHEWISYFEKISDVQNVVMAILVLQGLDVMYKTQLRTPLPSTNSILELSYFQERTTLQQELSSAQHCRRVLDVGHGPNADTYDLSPSNTTVSFTLDTSYDLQADEEASVTVSAATESGGLGRDRLHDQVSHPIMWNEMKPFTKNHSLVERYARDLRLFPNDQLPRFAHCVAMYANILYASGAFLRHARLLRTWTWGLRSKAQAQNSQFSLTLNVDNPWPLGVTEALLLPVCPTCSKPTAPSTPTFPLQSPIPTVSCPQCTCDLSVPNVADPLTDNMDSVTKRHLPNLQCTICRTRVRGLVFLCERCNHGGHIDHLSQWFRDSATPDQPRQCPALSCQCYCIIPDPVQTTSVFVS